MALFGRRRQPADSDVPADLQQYYSSGPSSSIGRWVARIVLFLVVLALLIWGGVALFNKLSNRNEVAKAPTSNQQTDAQKKAAEDKAKADAEAKKTADAKAKADAEAKKQQEAANKKLAEEQQKAKGSTVTPAPAATPTPPTATAPAAGGSGGGSGTLPNTGPSSGALAGIFAGTTAVAAIFHSIYTRRKPAR